MEQGQGVHEGAGVVPHRHDDRGLRGNPFRDLGGGGSGHDEPRVVLVAVGDPGLQDIETEEPCRLLAGDGGNRRVTQLPDPLARECGVGEVHDLTVLQLGEEVGALSHRLWMAVHPAQVGDDRTFDPEETVANPKPDVAHELKLALEQEVVDLRYRTRGGVLDGEDGHIGFPSLHCGHGIGEGLGPHVVDRDPLGVVELLGCELAVRALDALDRNRHRAMRGFDPAQELLLDANRVVDDLPPQAVDQTRIDVMVHPGGDPVGDQVLLAHLVAGRTIVDSLLLGDAKTVSLSFGEELEDVGVDPVDVVPDLLYVTWFGFVPVVHGSTSGACEGFEYGVARGWGGSALGAEVDEPEVAPGGGAVERDEVRRHCAVIIR